MRCEGPEEKEEVEEQFDVVIHCAGSDAASIDLLARPARVNEDYFREIKACFVLSMSHSSSDIVTNISSTSHATSVPSTSKGKSIGMEVPEIVLLGDRGRKQRVRQPCIRWQTAWHQTTWHARAGCRRPRA